MLIDQHSRTSRTTRCVKNIRASRLRKVKKVVGRFPKKIKRPRVLASALITKICACIDTIFDREYAKYANIGLT